MREREHKALSVPHSFTPNLYFIADLAFWLSGWRLLWRFGRSLAAVLAIDRAAAWQDRSFDGL
jgi:hypothetical protein